MYRKVIPFDRPDFVADFAEAILEKKPAPFLQFWKTGVNDRKITIDTPYERIEFHAWVDMKEGWYHADFRTPDDGWIGAIDYFHWSQEWEFYCEEPYFLPESSQDYNYYTVEYKRRVLEDIVKGGSQSLYKRGDNRWQRGWLRGHILYFDNVNDGSFDVSSRQLFTSDNGDFEQIEGDFYLMDDDELFSSMRRFFFIKLKLSGEPPFQPVIIYWPYETRLALYRMLKYHADKHRKFKGLQMLEIGGLTETIGLHYTASIRYLIIDDNIRDTLKSYVPYLI